MCPVFHSGAFVQQCFAVHPLCLSVKRLTGEHLILSCSNCNLAHRLTVRAVHAVQRVMPVEEAAGAAQPPGDPAADLRRCAAEHPGAVRISAMDVVRDAAGVRCADCRRLYELEVAAFETHQK